MHTKYYDHTGRLDVVDDPDEENLRIIRRWKRRMLAARPELSLGYNLQIMNSVYPDNEEIMAQGMRNYGVLLGQVAAHLGKAEVDDEVLNRAFPLWTFVHGLSFLLIDEKATMLKLRVDLEDLIRQSTRRLLAD